MAREASAWADHLEALGARPGDAVVAVLPNSAALATLYLGAALARVRIVPVDPLAGETTRAEIEAQVRPSVTIHAAGPEGIAPRPEMKGAAPPMHGLGAIDPNAPWLTTFTSGSTGRPKGVVHSFGNLLASAAAIGQMYPLDGRRFYHNLPMSYMAGILNLLIVPWSHGGAAVLGPRFSASAILTFWNEPIAHGVDAFWFVPTEIEMLLRMDRGDDGRRFFGEHDPLALVATAPLRTGTARAFHDRYGSTPLETYGLSETLFVSGAQEASDDAPRHLLPGASAATAPDGELLIDVPWMFLGYLGEDRPHRPFATGDLADLSDGLRITGRKKDLILRGGVNISPQRIEATLAELLPGVDAAVIGAPDPTLGERTVCFLERADAELPEGWRRRVVQELSRRLGPDHVVDEFRPASHIPRTSTGKLDRPALRTGLGR